MTTFPTDGITPKTNVSNYSGIFNTGESYKKFDFIFNTGDGLFYYAKQDTVGAGSTYITGDYRFTLDNAPGPTVGGSPTYFIYDANPDASYLGQPIQEGQRLYLGGTTGNSDGFYDVIKIEENYKDESLTNTFYDIETALDLSSIGSSWYSSSWFFRPNLGEVNVIDANLVHFVGDTNWGYHIHFGWIYVIPVKNQTQAVWFFIPFSENKNFGSDGLWFYANSTTLGNPNAASNSFLYIAPSVNENPNIPDSTVHWTKDSRGIYDSVFYNYANSTWYGFKQNSLTTLSITDGAPTEVVIDPNSNPDITEQRRIQVQGENDNIKINAFEARSSNIISFSGIGVDPAGYPDIWTRDLFFFDADYGSSVSFRGNNLKQEFGNGYYTLQPKNINSLSFEVDLKFNNRTSREANAIIHFVENHLGQLEKDSNSVNLAYTQGVSGFRWDGNAVFHPYDSNGMQSKTFYCSEFNHSLNFENSNDITLRLRNLNTSILRKSQELYVRSPDDYDDNEYYAKNDVVFSSGNHKYYYFHSGDSLDFGVAGFPPVTGMEQWTRESGYFKDINQQYWTREFSWKPSIGLSVSQKPRMQELALGASYTQIYRDGINESLLNLDLQFKNRDDQEAYAILHFLEQQLGYAPFVFTPPAPYDSTRNFVCQEWSHTYNYKNNHTISAKFEEFPFNLSAEQIDSMQSPPTLSDGELVFSSPVALAIKGQGGVVTVGQIAKKRMFLKNIGDLPVRLDTVVLNPQVPNTFSVLGQTGNNNIPAVIPQGLTRDDYIFQLPATTDLDFDGFSLSDRVVKLSKSYENGLENGHMFDTMTGSDPYYVEMINGSKNTFFQNNRGQVKSGVSTATPTEFQSSDYFIVSKFLEQNTVTGIDGGAEAYMDVSFNGITEQDLNVLVDAETNSQIGWVDEASPGVRQGDLAISNHGRYYYCDMVINSSTEFSPQTGELKVYISPNE